MPNWKKVITSGSDATLNTLTVTNGITGSLEGTSSYALTASYTPAISGTDNYIPKFNGTSALENSLIYDNGTNVGIGTTSPSAKLDVTGEIRSDKTANGISFLATGGGSAITAFDVYTATNGGLLRLYDENGQTVNIDGRSSSTNTYFNNGGNVGIGTTSPSEKLDVVGKIALNDGGNSVFIGTEAGLNDDASDNRNVGIGYQALYNNTTGINNTANGFRALYNNTTGNNNTANGFLALYNNTTGNNNTANGYQALRSNTTGNQNTANGYQAGRYIADKSTPATIVNDSVLLGYRTSPLADDQTNQIVIGYDATGLGSNTAVLGNDSIVTTALKGNVGIGTTSPSTKLDVQGDITITNAKISNQENTDVDTGTEVVATVAISTYTAAFFDFVIKNGTNVRSGTVFACHDGTNVEFTETSTADLGNTADVTLSVDISGTDMRLLATTTTDNWSIKSLVRAL